MKRLDKIVTVIRYAGAGGIRSVKKKREKKKKGRGEYNLISGLALWRAGVCISAFCRSLQKIKTRERVLYVFDLSEVRVELF